jgi:hypothetical protein
VRSTLVCAWVLMTRRAGLRGASGGDLRGREIPLVCDLPISAQKARVGGGASGTLTPPLSNPIISHQSTDHVSEIALRVSTAQLSTTALLYNSRSAARGASRRAERELSPVLRVILEHAVTYIDGAAHPWCGGMV